jgi:hypothetical protein
MKLKILLQNGGETKMVHTLKTDKDVFIASYIGDKPYELRLNDRNFQVGDSIILQETEYSGEEMKNGKPLIYTGREKNMKINYILFGPIYGLKKGWVILS